MFVGDGPERPVAENLSRELGVFGDIRFVGKQEQMEEILVVSDLFLLTSDYESFGLSALEAMAARMPVISTNAGGLPEVNIHGKTGYMSNVADVEDMTTNAVNLLSDETLLAEFKQNAYDQACRFDIKNIIPVYEKLYSRFCTMECEKGQFIKVK